MGRFFLRWVIGRGEEADPELVRDLPRSRETCICETPIRSMSWTARVVMVPRPLGGTGCRSRPGPTPRLERRTSYDDDRTSPAIRRRQIDIGRTRRRGVGWLMSLRTPVMDSRLPRGHVSAVAVNMIEISPRSDHKSPVAPASWADVRYRSGSTRRLRISGQPMNQSGFAEVRSRRTTSRRALADRDRIHRRGART